MTTEQTNNSLRTNINNRFFRNKCKEFNDFRKYCIDRHISYDAGLREGMAKLMEKSGYKYAPQYIYIYFRHFLIDENINSILAGLKKGIKLLLDVK